MNDDKKRLPMENEDSFLNGMGDGLPEDAGSPSEEEAVQQARQLEARRHAEVQEFLAVFPNAAREPIPQEVWNAVNQGFSLTAAYARYQQARQRAQMVPGYSPVRGYSPVPGYSPVLGYPSVPMGSVPPASTGSMRSAGYGHGPKDPFLDGLESDW